MKKIAAEPQGQSGGSPDSATGTESPYVGSSLGLPSAWLQGTGASSAGIAPVAMLAEQTPAASSGGPDAAPKGTQKLVSTATGERKRQPEGTLGGEVVSAERGVVKAMPADPGGRTAESAPGAGRRGAGQGPVKVMPASSQGKIADTYAAPSLATPPAFPGTLGVDPRLPEGAGSRAMLQAQEGHVRPSEALPSVPAGTLKAGMAEASGAEGPKDEQGVGPFGGGGAQYTASLGLSTPEPMRIDDRGRADLSGYRGKSNGIAHEWAQAYADKQYAWSKVSDAETKEEAAYWAEKAEDAEIRLNQADEKIDRSGDADTIRKQAWEDKHRIQRREDRARAREEAAADRAAQRLERKGRAWQSNRRHQVNERAKRRDRRRERRLEGRLSEESMKRWRLLQNGTKDGKVKGINQLRDRLEEIENKLDDPRTPPGERYRLEQEKKEIEAQIEEKELDQYWEEHGGFPCAELDCCDQKYRKCRPPCPPRWKCVCRKPAYCGDPPAEKKEEGGDDEGKDKDKDKSDKESPITPGASGKHAAKEAQPPDIEPQPVPGGDGGEPPEVESPDDGGDGVGADAESPDDGPPARPRRQPLGDPPPREFTDGNQEYPVDEGEGLVQGRNGLWYELQDKKGERVTVAALPVEVRSDGTKVYKLAGFKRSWLPRLTGKHGPNRLAEKVNAYWEAAKSIAKDATGFLAQMIGAFAGLGFEAGLRIGALISGKDKPTMDDLMGPIKDLIATTDFANLSEFEAWAVSTLASAIEGFAAPGDTFKAFGKGLIESPKAFAQMLKDAANGDAKAQLSLLLFALTFRPGQTVAAAKRLMSKVRSLSASAARSLEKLAATTDNVIDDVVAALEKRKNPGGVTEYVGKKVRFTVDEHGQVTKFEAVGEPKPVGEVKPSGAAGGGGVGGGQPRRAAASGGLEDPTGKKPPASGQEPERVAVSAQHEAAGTPRGSSAGGSASGASKTVAEPPPEPTKKPPAKAGGGKSGGGGGGKRPTARGGGDASEDPAGSGRRDRRRGGRGWRDGDPLPDVDRAWDVAERFDEYLLDPMKSKGKWEIFKSHGLEKGHGPMLEKQIRAQLGDAPAHFAPDTAPQYGTKYFVDVDVRTPSGKVLELRAWFRAKANGPQMINCLPRDMVQ